MSKSKSKQAEALQLLDDLDSFTPIEAPSAESASSGGSPVPRTSTSSNRRQDLSPNNANSGSNQGETAEALAFLDEIQQRATEPAGRPSHSISRSGTPTLRKSTERVKLGGGTSASLVSGASASATSLQRQLSSSAVGDSEAKKAPESSSRGGWGWGSVWSSASAAIQQAKTVVDEQVKSLPQVNNEQAKKWREGVIEYAKTAQLDKIGQDFKRVGLSTLTDILNVVAPPISEHEVIQVWLSHDMQGYDGVETLAYRALARVMEQVEGGDLIVNRGNESKPKEGSDQRNLNAVDGYEAAVKLAQANLEEMAKSESKSESKPKSSTITSPTTYSHVYLRIQPFFTTYHVPASGDISPSSAQQLAFLLYLFDQEHQLVQVTTTQSIPSQWMSIWDQYDWVEDLMAEALRVGFEAIGQEYVVSRMGWAGKGKEVGEKVMDKERDVGNDNEDDEDDEDEDEEDEEEEHYTSKAT